MPKNKNNALKGGYKYKQIMRRYGKKNTETVRKVVRIQEPQHLSPPVYIFSSTVESEVEIEYSYTQALPQKPKVIPKSGNTRGEG